MGTCQSYFANWTTVNEFSVYYYVIEQSADTVSWHAIDSAAKGGTPYHHLLPSINSYFRIKSVGVDTFYTRAILLTLPLVLDAAVISNIRVSTSVWNDRITWTTTGESNVSYYLIEKYSGGWGQVAVIAAKGNSAYATSYQRPLFSKRLQYRITSVFRDGKQSPPITFK